MSRATDHPWFTSDGQSSYIHSHCAYSHVGLQGQGIRTGGGISASLSPSRTVSWQDVGGLVVTAELVQAELARPCGEEAAIRRAVQDAMQGAGP